MSKEFRDLLEDVIKVVEPFSAEISFILMKRDRDDDIVLVAKSKTTSIQITAMSLKDIPDFDGVACFGSIPYLGAVVKSKYLKGSDFSMEVEYREAKDYPKSIGSINFKGGNNKLEAFYQATDPFVNKMNKVRPEKIDNWPVEFEITQEVIKDFTEIQKVHKASPKMGSDRDDLFTLAYNGGSVIAMFGDKSHRSNMTLCEDAKCDDSVSMVNALISVSNFQAILKLIGKGKATARLTDRGLKVELVTELATYSLIIAAKKRSL